MAAFVDTSALYALLDADDLVHEEASATWDALRAADEVLFTTNYVLLETAMLLQRRVGLAAVEGLLRGLAPLLQVHCVGNDEHMVGVEALLAARRRDLNLVDCVSFAVMLHLHVADAFTFDAHFAEQGFTVVPPPA